MFRFSRSLCALALSAVFLGLAACTPHKVTDGRNGPGMGDASNDATFYVVSGEGWAELNPVVIDHKWQVPTSATLHLTACMVDRASSVKAKQQAFVVDDDNGNLVKTPDAASSDDGCIKWTEPLAFNYYAKQSAPIQIVRRIVGNGVHTGYYVIRYAIDPWAISGFGGSSARDSIKAVQYLQDSSPPVSMIADPPSISKALSGEMNGGATLWINEMKIKVLDRQDFKGGQDLDFELDMEPFVQWLDNNKAIGFQPITTGEFEIFAHLVITNAGGQQKQKMIVTPNQLSSFAPVINNSLMTTLHATVQQMTPNGNLTLAIRLVPRGYSGAVALQSYEAIYDLGPAQNIGKVSSGRLAQSCVDGNAKVCNLKSYLSDATNYKEMKAEGYAFANDPLSFGDLNLKFVTVAPNPPETATSRTIAYSISTCVTNRSTGELVSRMPFKITYVPYLDSQGNAIPDPNPQPPEPPQTVKTNDDGCLEWTEYINHDYYRPERFYARSVQISMGDGTAGTKLSYIVNPWDYGWAFGFDLRKVSPELVQEWLRPDHARIPSRLFLDGYDYHTLRFLYSFDKFMNLEVHKTVLLRLIPKMLRYSGVLNARKTTEDLRDGLYLLKVALQKSYLDPAARGLSISSVPKALQPVIPTDSPKDPRATLIQHRSFVSTYSVLVRVVDGVIVTPIELEMTDLRLMRLRSNFMIEMESVDERLLKADPVFSSAYLQDLDSFEQTLNANTNLSADQKAQSLQAHKNDVQNKLRSAWNDLQGVLSGASPIMDNNQIPADLQNLIAPINSALGQNDFTMIHLPDCTQTDCNRFVEPTFAASDTKQTDPQTFAPRTFVGPVTFLENNYSDAVRATDNLDDVCNRTDNPFLTSQQKAAAVAATQDPYASFFKGAGDGTAKPTPDQDADKIDGMGEDDWFGNQEMVADSSRENQYYKFSAYYGAQTYLCYKNVDDMINNDLKEQTADYNAIMPLRASLANLTSTFNYDFAILNDANSKEYTFGDSPEAADQIVERINRDAVQRNTPTPSIASMIMPFSAPRQWTAADLPNLFFGSDQGADQFTLNQDQTVGLCGLLAETIADNLVKFEPDPTKVPQGSAFWQLFTQMHFDFYRSNPKALAGILYQNCMDSQSSDTPAIAIDEKLRVLNTGTNYTFDGGLQMNVNVGESFSLDYSNSYGRSEELLDVAAGLLGAGYVLWPGARAAEAAVAAAGDVAASAAAVATTATDTAATATTAVTASPVAKKAAGLGGFLLLEALKPLSQKGGNSLGSSNGTSISNQTYLVAQIAKFEVELTSYEKCRGFHFNSSFITNLFQMWAGIPMTLFSVQDFNMGTQDATERTLMDVFTRGIFVCSGEPINKSRKVPEDYFYFTQHFTEGDMLDQADLLNNPWLLSLRGDRDFATFMRAIEADEVVDNMSDFGYGANTKPTTRPIDWPLQEMAAVYRQTTATIPGFYTVLPPSERITAFPIDGRIIKIDQDTDDEICNVPSLCPGLHPPGSVPTPNSASESAVTAQSQPFQ